MSPYAYFGLIIITIIALVALQQIPLLQTIITNSGFDSNQVWAGIGAVLLVFYTVGYIFTAGRD